MSSYLSWYDGASADECVVVLLCHGEAYPLVNEAPYTIANNNASYELATTRKAFGFGSLRAKAATTTRSARTIDYTGAPGGGIESTNGKFTIEFRFSRIGGSGAADGTTLWSHDFYLEFDTGAWLQFTQYNGTGPNSVGYRLAIDDGIGGYDDYEFSDYTWSGDAFHAVAISIDGGALRLLFDGTTLETHTLSVSIPAGALLTLLTFGGLLDTERMDEARVIVGRAAYSADYTPTTAGWLTADCDSGTGDPYLSNVLLLMNAAATNTTDATGQQTLSVTGSVPINSTQTLFGANTYELDTSGDYIAVSNNAFFCAPADAQEWTIEGWAYITDAVDSTSHIIFSTPFTVQMATMACTDIASSAYTASGTAIALNQWVHWAFVRDNSGATSILRRYIGGVQDGVSLTFGLTEQVTNTGSFGQVMGRVGSFEPKGSFCHHRWTMGVCRYPGGTTFTPPTAAFPTT
jgi:hypothetical protein